MNQSRKSDLGSESKFDTVYRKDKNPSIKARHPDLSTIMLPDHILTNWTPDEILDAYLILNGYQKTDSSSNRQSEFIGQNKGQQKDLSLSDNLEKHTNRENVCYPAIKNPIDKIKSTPDIKFLSIRTNLESVQWDNCSFPPQTIVGQGENGSVPSRISTPSKQDTSPPKLLIPEVFDAQEQSTFASKRHLTPRTSYCPLWKFSLRVHRVKMKL